MDKLPLAPKPPCPENLLPPEAPPKLEGFFGAKCGNCGFEYCAYDGHIIPCPCCRFEIAKEALKKAYSYLVIFKMIENPRRRDANGASAAEIIDEALTELDL
jgi:hypothetical protein